MTLNEIFKNTTYDGTLFSEESKAYVESKISQKTVRGSEVPYITCEIRKKEILEYLKHKPSITNQKAQELCGYTKDQAYRILRKLVEEGKIEVKGAGRGRRYCLKENQR